MTWQIKGGAVYESKGKTAEECEPSMDLNIVGHQHSVHSRENAGSEARYGTFPLSTFDFARKGRKYLIVQLISTS